MTEQALQDSLEIIYSTFGKSVPASGVVRAIRDRVSNIPDEVMPWIVEKICDEEKLPTNVGLAVSRGWDAWQRANPQRVVRTVCKSGCDGGFWHCWEADPVSGRMVYFLSRCHMCRGRENPSPQALYNQGVDVMPSGFKGGPMEFDRMRGYGVLYPLADSGRTGDAAKVDISKAVETAPDWHTRRDVHMLASGY